MRAPTGGRVLVLAKAPVPGRVKTRLCPPCTPEQAARVAAAALADTIDTVDSCSAHHRVLVVDGSYPAPAGWSAHAQRGSGLPERLANAFTDYVRPGAPALLIGMDTPQLTAGHLDAALDLLTAPDRWDAVLGPATDGGWWALGLRDPGPATALGAIATSRPDTGAATLAALRGGGLRVTLLPMLRDVDVAADAYAVAARCAPDSRFARAVTGCLPDPAVPR